LPVFSEDQGEKETRKAEKNSQQLIPTVDQRPELFTRNENDYEGMAKHYEEIILATPRKERDEETQPPSLGELLQNAPIKKTKGSRAAC